MQRLARVLVAAALIASLTVLVAPASASSPVSETIVLVRDAQNVEAGWSASGTFSDQGSWTTDRGVCGGCVQSPVVGALSLITTQTGANGSTFTLQFHWIFNAFGLPLPQSWSVLSGTGDYATLRGGGDFTVADQPDGSRVFTLTGQVHFN
jgi:hypothetical protein